MVVDRVDRVDKGNTEFSPLMRGFSFVADMPQENARAFFVVIPSEASDEGGI